VATGGHGQFLAGMREMVWSLRERTRAIRDLRKRLQRSQKQAQQHLQILNAVRLSDLALPPPSTDSDQAPEEQQRAFQKAIEDQIKTQVDQISRELMRLRMDAEAGQKQDLIQALADKRLQLRRLGWRSSFAAIPAEELQLLELLVPLAKKHHKAVITDAKRQLKLLQSARRFRSLAREKELVAVISLHLSSQGDGFGAFNQGWLHPLKPIINRVKAYSAIDDALKQAAAKARTDPSLPALFQDTLRPSRLRSWQSYFIDQPALSGEVSSLAGIVGITLATTNDARSYWGTPYDQPQRVNWDKAIQQSRFVTRLIYHVSQAATLQTNELPRHGFSTVSGRVHFLRHGELFADQPAAGTTLLAFQGPAHYHARVDAMGMFHLRGVADKKHVLHKVIIEGYRFDPQTGRVQWAIDKKQTGKPAYRVKMVRRAMETKLVMFACKQSTLFNLLEPRNFHYMTKIQLLDARREAAPVRYWWSRTDTRSSVSLSLYLQSGTPYKLTLSDTVLRNKMVLTNTSPDHPAGTGYMIDEWPSVPFTELQVARDMWGLLEPRITNLEKRGIYDERIRQLFNEGRQALEVAQDALGQEQYDQLFEAARRSWALASRVYDHVQKTQKDVLFGVLFYVALFVPFAFCMERFLFAYANIHKRIIAFLAILLLLIFVIYQVHPAFQLAYSPMVVILAFFIVGLSLIVTLIIFFRFEEEMIQLQKRARKMRVSDISRWKAFVAAFFLGVTNLRRRRLRTVLTCTTLIILTFTIMSFTSVKSLRHHTRVLYQDAAPYHGLLLKNVNWKDFPPEAADIIANGLGQNGVVAPRVWMENEDKTKSTRIPIQHQDNKFYAQGLIGLSPAEGAITGLDQIMISGRWFTPADRHAILLPQRLAQAIGIDASHLKGQTVKLWGRPFEVVGIFSSQALQNRPDLDGEILTPVTFPSETSVIMTEEEMDALESGDDVRSFQSRYQHIAPDLTVFVPYQTLLAMGGHLKSVAFQPVAKISIHDLAQQMVDRFGLSLFSGEEEGNFLYHASDTMRYSGVPNIVIPLIISVFIVLNTMIGSVYERKREIGIYTSVGLAPSHVSFLFIAEALAFAVLSVVLGYLLAQASAKFFAGSGLWSGITVNYSSLAGVAAMVLVIIVVLISVIYPSRVAAEIAIPDVNRSWKLPDHKTNLIKITLPFLMKYSEQKGVGGYLLEHFKGHQDVTHGLFSTGDIQCDLVATVKTSDAKHPESEIAAAEALLRIKTKVWLAPFDFGIMQQVALRFYPCKEEPGMLEIRLLLVRRTGEVNAWGRINKVFLNDLRKQLLIWRSLDTATCQQYESQMDSILQQNREDTPRSA
jgi:cell division protein FtsX